MKNPKLGAGNKKMRIIFEVFEVLGQTCLPGEPLGGLGQLPGAGWILEPIFRENVPKTMFFFHGSGAGEVHEGGSTGYTGSSGSSGSRQNEPQRAALALGSPRLRPG